MSASVSAWLQDLGLQQYAELFEANDIDWELLADIDQQTLREIGIQSVGHRIRILEAANLSLRGFTFRYRNQPEPALRDYREALELAARTRHLRAESVACYAGL